jgi:hypothetical protein
MHGFYLKHSEDFFRGSVHNVERQIADFQVPDKISPSSAQQNWQKYAN